MLTQSIKSYIREHAQEESPNESCGLVIERQNGELEPFRTRNVAENTKHNFQIHSMDYLQASVLGEIKAIYHSHTSDKTRFSDKDKINILAHKLPWILYCLPTDQFIESGDADLTLDFVGIPFQINKSDCFTLIRNYFRQKLSIEIGEYSYNDKWYKECPDIYEKNFEKEGFVKVQNAPIDVEKLELHDVLLLQMLPISFPSHSLVYIGQNQVLHHPRNKLSTVEHLTKAFIKRTLYVIRHKNLCKI